MNIKRSVECDMYVGGGFEPRLIDMPNNWQFDEGVKSITVTVTWEMELEPHACIGLTSAGDMFTIDEKGRQVFIYRTGRGDEIVSICYFKHCPYCGKELEVFDMD